MSDISWTIKNGDIEQARTLFTSENVNELHNGRTALHFAADYGQSTVADMLIQLGANVNARDQYGITPLLAAVWEGHYAIIQMLINQGADCSVKSPDGKTLVECTEDERIKKLVS